MMIGQSLWVVLVAYVCSFLGALQVPILMSALTYALVGFIYNVKYSDQDSGGSDTENGADRNLSILDKCASFWEPSFKSTPNRLSNPTAPSSVQDVTASPDVDSFIHKTKTLELNEKNAVATENESIRESSKKPQSEIYFKALFLACLITILYKQLLVLCLAFIPIVIYLTNKLLDMFGFKDYAMCRLEEFGARVQVRYEWV